MKTKAFIFIFTLLPLFVYSAEFANMEKALDVFFSGKQPDREKALKFFLENEEDSLRFLHNYFNPDCDLLIKNLGHKDFDKREKATEMLSVFGVKHKRKISSLQKETKDPEIRSRCKQILEKLKINANIRDKYLDMALIIFLTSETNPKISTPFLERFFIRYKSLPGETRKLLPQAMKKSENRPQLLDKILAMMEYLPTEKDFELATGTLRKMKPDKSEDLIKRERHKFLKRSLNVRPYISLRLSSSSDFEKIIRRIYENEKDLEAKKKLFVEVLMEEKYINNKALGAYLIKDDPAPYKDRILEIVKSLRKDQWNLFIWTLERFPGRKELFKDSIEVFLKSESRDVAEFGLELIEDDPSKYRELIIKGMMNPERTHISTEFGKFIKNHFPEEKERMTKLLVDTLLKTDDEKRIPSLCYNLGEAFDYKGKDFDDWWLALANNPEKFKKLSWVILWRAPDLNITPDIVIPFIDDKTTIHGDFAKYLLGCKDEKLRKKVIKRIIDKFEKDGDTYTATVIIDKNPELIPLILPRILKKQDEDPEHIEDYDNFNMYHYIPDFGKHIKNDKRTISKIKPFLKSGKPDVRFHAALLLKEAGLKKNEWLHAIESFDPDKVPDAMAIPLVKELLAHDVSKEKTLPYIKKLIFSTNKDLHGEYVIFYFFDERNRDYIADFEKIISNDSFLRNKKTRDKIINLAEATLYIESDNLSAIQTLKNIALDEQDYDSAWAALKVLLKFKVEPNIPQDRLRKMYSRVESIYTANSALLDSDKLVPFLVPIIKDNIRLNILDNYPGFSTIVNNNEKLQKALIPFLVKMTHSDSPERRDFALRVLSGSTDFLTPHLGDLRRSWKGLKNRGPKNSFLWMLANIGQDADSFVDLVEENYAGSKGEEKFFYFFAMARIHPDKTVRKKMTLELLNRIRKREIPKDFEDNAIRMLSLIKEFPEISHPFFKEDFLNKKGLDPSESGWALARIEPFTEYAETAFLKKITSAYEGNKREIGTLMGLISSQPESFRGYLKYIDLLPQEARFEWWFRDARKALVNQKDIE